jgi:two-component system, LuxR family, sensor kinase FixL
MSYITIIWSSCAAAALLLGLLHGLAWIHDRRAHANLAFAIAAFCLCSGAVIELGTLHARTPQEFGNLIWWLHFPMTGVIIATALFLRLYLRAGRWWLLSALIAARGAVFLLNAFSSPNFNFARIDAIERISFLGEQVTVVASAVTGQHQWLALCAVVLFPAFVLDVGVTLLRRNAPGDRRLVGVIVAPVLATITLSSLLTQLVIWRISHLPILLVPPFLIALTAMTIELSRDVLRASRLARDLRESERRLDLAASAAGAGLWAWDAATGRFWATERTRATLGLSQGSEILPSDLLRIVHVDDAAELKAALKHALEHGGAHTLQFRIAWPGGETRWIAVDGTVDLRETGEPDLLRGVMRDVTQQRRAEEEVKELRQKLAHAGRVTMLGQLASAIAHELSQPLSAIQHNVETAQILLARAPVDMRLLREIIDDVLRDDRRAADVLQHLRTWLKQGRINTEEVRMDELAQDVVTLVRADATIKHVAIDCAVPRTLPPVRADRVHLSQVMLNLLMNAIEAVSAGKGPQRRVSIEAHVRADACCEVSVSDTGPGISPDELDRIFDPFVTAKANGMGIGLSISRSIVEAHGGKLWAESGARGATFHFTVPLQSAGQLQPVEAASTA